MSPPDLSGYAPVTDILKPVQVNLIKTLWYKLKLTILDRLNGWFCKLFHLYEPLLFDHWLYRCMTSVVSSYIMRMWNNFYKISLLFQILYHSFSCFVAIHACIFSTILLIDRSIIIHDVKFWQIVTFSNFKVVRVMCRCDLNSTCSELFVYVVICNNRNLTVCQWQLTHLSNDIFISLIIRVNCNCSISQKSLRTCCCNLKETVCSYDWVLNVPEESVLLFMFYLGIRQGSLTYRTPVDDSGASVNESFFMKVQEYFLNCFRTSLVHCETLSVPVTGNTHLFKL